MNPTQLSTLLGALELTRNAADRDLGRRCFLEGLCALLQADAGEWVELGPNGLESSVEYGVVTRPVSVRSTRGGKPAKDEPPLLYSKIEHDGRHHFWSFHRLPGAAAFDDAQAELLRLVSRHHWLLGSALQSSDPVVDKLALPPRLRQTLDLLLSGAREKEIAEALALSAHTVHDYVKGLYRRLNVTSRSELMATLLRPRPTPASVAEAQVARFT